MNIIKKVIQWLKCNDTTEEKIKWSKNGHLGRGTIRGDGMVLWNTWLLIDGTRKYKWITKEEYQKWTVRQREYVKKYYYKKKGAK